MKSQENESKVGDFSKSGESRIVQEGEDRQGRFVKLCRRLNCPATNCPDCFDGMQASYYLPISDAPIDIDL